MTILIRILGLILSLSFLVMIHELGHFIFARINGVRVSKFYMFFNPQISLFRMKKIKGKWQFRFLAKNVYENQKVALDENGNPLLWENDKDEKERKRWAKKKALTEEEWAEIEEKFNFGRKLPSHTGHPKFTVIEEDDLSLLADDDWRKYPETTEWGIGWLPLGGYCAIAGMVDETTSADQLSSEPKEWEYRAKRTWQRLPIICGGVLVNFIGAFVIYSAVLHHWGQSYVPVENAKYGLYYSDDLLSEGFQQGDRILSVDGKEPEYMKDLINWMVIEGNRNVLALRGQDTVEITLSEHFDRKVIASGAKEFIDFRFPYVIADVLENSAADKAQLQEGDSLIAVGGVATPAAYDVVAELRKHPCDSVDVTYVRSGETKVARVFLGDEPMLGVHAYTYTRYLDVKVIEYGFFACIPAGIQYGWETLVNYVKQFRLVFTPEGAQSLGGFGSIGSLFPPAWDWYQFWMMTALLSVILGFMNIIPIPGLDGGHVLFLLWEMVTGKKPNDKFLEIANNIGFYLLLALLIYANGNDILKFFF